MDDIRMDRHGNVTKARGRGRKARRPWLEREVDRWRAGLLDTEGLAEALLSELGWNLDEKQVKVIVPRQAEDDKQYPAPTPRGNPLPDWEGEVEVTDEDVDGWLRDWDRKAPRAARGLLDTEKAE